jgi:predicted Zn-dependent protease
MIKVAVYTGISPIAQYETGLATVMGHEVAHAVARRAARRRTHVPGIADPARLMLGTMSKRALLMVMRLWQAPSIKQKTNLVQMSRVKVAAENGLQLKL